MGIKGVSIEKVGIGFGIFFGLWGAGLSTYQEIRSQQKESPVLFTQLQVSRAAFVEGATERPVTVTVSIQNAGKTPVALLPDVDLVAIDPASGAVGTARGQFATNSVYALPQTLQPGQQATVTATSSRSENFFGPNVIYSLTLQTVDGRVFEANDVAGPMKTPEEYRVLREYVKYQGDIKFHSRAAVEVMTKSVRT